MLQRNEFLIYMVLLTMMSTMGLLASDVYLPVMPELIHSLHTDPVSIQLTLGIYLLGLSVSQLFCGPLSDHYGRRKVLLAGIGLYTIASFGCVFAQSVEQLVLIRFIQAIGACTGLVVGRATISDQFDLKESAKIYNIVYPLVAASPAIAPLIGGYLSTWYGWRSTFGFVAFYGLILFTLACFFLKETRKNNSTDGGSFIFKIFIDSPKLLCNAQFLSYVISVCAIYGAWFVYLSESTFIFESMGYVKHQVGFFYIPLAMMIYVGNMLSKQLLKYIKHYHVFLCGFIFFVTGSIVFVINQYVRLLSGAMSLVVPMSIIAMSNGILLPIGIASAISLFSSRSGAASGLVGFCQIGAASLCSSVIGKVFGITSATLSWSLLSLALIGFFGHLLLFNLTRQLNKQRVIIRA